jgi:hypothetical protein
MDVAFAQHLASVVAHERSEAEAYLAFRMAALQAAGDRQVGLRLYRTARPVESVLVGTLFSKVGICCAA